MQAVFEKMFKLVSKHVRKVSVLRKLIFALVNLPADLPNLWDVVVQFATKDEDCSLSSSDIKVLLENIEELDSAAFTTDSKLLQELMKFHVPRQKPLGCVLISLPGNHYHKYCSCGFTQYYGYYTTGGSAEVHYNPNWESLPYFVSSRETAFSMDLLKRFNAEILLGQNSFKQCADVYNYLHNYNQGNKLSRCV